MENTDVHNVCLHFQTIHYLFLVRLSAHYGAKIDVFDVCWIVVVRVANGMVCYVETRSGPNRPAAAIGGELSRVIPWKI